MIRHQIRRARIRQKDIAYAVGASQSQVSRVLSGHSGKRSKLFLKICIYVKTAQQGVSHEAVHENGSLISALAETWNGSPEHAEALATVIRSLAALLPQPAAQHTKRD